VELVVTDLDGTLWHTDDTVHPDTRAAVDEVARRGLPLLVATGRRVGSTVRPLARFGLAPPAVVLNGALGLDGAEVFQQHPFDADLAVATLGAFRAAGVDPAVYVLDPEVEVFLSPTPGTSAEHVRDLGSDAAVTSDLTAVVAEKPVLSFSIIGTDYEVAQQVVKQLGDTATATLDRSINLGGAALIVSPPGLTKWEGVAAFCDRRGLNPDRVLAIGDGPNDVELLSRAAVALSLTGSHPTALAEADHVVGPAAQGGWAELLEWL
jgi:HAD superfamily hydrolase (TIGR01484 family)